MKSKHRIPLITLSILSLLGTTQGFAQTPFNPPQPNLGTQSMPSGDPVPQVGEIIPAGDMSLPPQGVPGNCYARVYEDAVYGIETDKMLAKQASERIEIIPAQYEWVEQKILIREAYEREEVVPAVYGTESKEILVKPATTRWKKGRGLVETVDNFTGEIMCLVEVPAEYKTVTTTVVKTPATTKLVQVPAEYQVVKVQKLVAPRQEKRIPIAAEYQTVQRTVLQSPGRMAWKSVICETNAPAGFKAKQVKAPAPAVITSIYSQSKSTKDLAPSSMQKSDKDWFFFWDYDELFDKGKWAPAHR